MVRELAPPNKSGECLRTRHYHGERLRRPPSNTWRCLKQFEGTTSQKHGRFTTNCYHSVRPSNFTEPEKSHLKDAMGEAGFADAKPKLAKLICYGADVLIVDGTSWEVFQLTCAASKKCGWYNIVAASRYNPYVKDGAKTECIEICEQLGWNAPDWLIVPVGGGCGLASCWKAVRELHRIGLIDKLPRMVGVQGAHCAPLVKAFDEKLPPDRIERFPNAHTVAHSIEDDYPPDGDQALIAIRESEGLALSIEDVTMLAAQALMAKKEGLFVEPASSATVAATRMLLEQGIIDRKDSIIAVATGSGLNEPDSVFSAFPQPPIIKPDIRELEVNLRGFR